MTAPPGPDDAAARPRVQDNAHAIVWADTGARVGMDVHLAASEPPLAHQHPASVYLARLAPGSRRTMRHALDAIAAVLTGGAADAWTLPWQALEYQHTTAVRAALAERFAPATANKMLSALRGVLKEAWRLGHLDAEAFRRATDLEPVRGETVPAGRAISAGELRALFNACLADPVPLAGVRNAAILALLYGGGLRRAEVPALSIGDYVPETGALTVRGKGRKMRLVYVAGGAQLALDAWLAARTQFSPTPTGALFLPVSRHGRIVARRMTDQTVFNTLRKLALAGGVDDFSPHDFRRTFIGDLLDAGADIATVQKLAGHANVQTTARYDRRGERAKQQAVGLLHVPYAGRRG